MSAISRHRGRGSRPRANDPRVLRSRAAALDAARTLFLRQGYAGTTMDEIAEQAGLTKRTLYNNYADKAELFTEIAAGVTTYAEEFARGLQEDFAAEVDAASLGSRLDQLGRRLALSVVRPEIVALRRLLIGESREFPALARKYYDRAPGQVIAALATGFARLDQAGLLRIRQPRQAAAQFAYLVVGAPLDRAMLTGIVPPRSQLLAGAREGVETFMARYEARA